jgi:hypothetical protein
MKFSDMTDEELNQPWPSKKNKTMKINELKIGDRVKYKIKHGICGTNSNETEIADGIILEIRDTYFQIKNDKYYCEQISVLKENIISKLEPVLCETLIEKEEYKRTEHTRNCPSCKHIFEYKNGCCGCFTCPNCNYHWNCAWNPAFPLYTSVIKTVSHPYSVPETKIYCCQCKEYVSSTSGMPISQYSVMPCQKCIDKYKEGKNKSKSFKFDINYVNKIEFNNSPIRPGYFSEAFFRIDGYSIKYYESNIDLNKINGKTLTVEIKEKEKE